MTPVLRKFSKRVLIFLNICTIAFFLLASLAAYINPGKYWIIGMLGVGFIFFLAGTLVFFLFWLFMRSRWAWLSLVALVLSWPQTNAVFGFHFFSRFDKAARPPGSLRILQWNVTSWDEINKTRKNGVTYRKAMFDYIEEQDADVLCFQEFFESKNPVYFDYNIDYIKNKLHYPYHYFAVDASWKGVQLGVAVFSRFPITDSARWRYQPVSRKTGESLVRVTLDMNGQKVNVFTTHLQSFLFKGQDYQNIEILKRPEDNKDKLVEASKGIMYKFRSAYKARPPQAELVREKLEESEYPSIITGDFNDVPNSYTYFTVKGDYQDAFVKKSHGLGRTFYFISPTLRIDYILADKRFEILQYKRDLKPYSDHYPVVADVMIVEPKSQ